MKKFVAGVVIASALISAPAIARGAKKEAATSRCQFGDLVADNPGEYFKGAMETFAPIEEKNIAEFLDYWWAVTEGSNSAENTGDFIKRDCNTSSR